MAKSATQIWSDVDLDGEGKQVGWLHLPHSVHRSAYGTHRDPGRGDRATATARPCFSPPATTATSTRARSCSPTLIRALQAERHQRPGHRPAGGSTSPRRWPAAHLADRRRQPEPLPSPATRSRTPTQRSPTTSTPCSPRCGTTSTCIPAARRSTTCRSPRAAARATPSSTASDGGAPGVQRAAASSWGFLPEPHLAVGAALRRGVVYLGGEFGGSRPRSIPRGAHEPARQHPPRCCATPACCVRAPAPRRSRRSPCAWSRSAAATTTSTPPAPACSSRCAARRSGAQGRSPGPHPLRRRPGAAEPRRCHFKSDGLFVCQRHPSRVERGDCLAHLANDIARGT